MCRWSLTDLYIVAEYQICLNQSKEDIILIPYLSNDPNFIFSIFFFFFFVSLFHSEVEALAHNLLANNLISSHVRS